jgi:D-alanine-D-alanine ligase-like ATP-grasp enzyme
MQVKTKKRVGILRGGVGNHYASSLKKGGEILLYISENLADKYKVVDILIDKDNVWYLNGQLVKPFDLIHKVDVVWNVAHPSFSNIFDSLLISNISIGNFSLMLQNSRDSLKEHIKNIGLSMPKVVVSPKNAEEVHEKFPAPWIVKSFTEDSNMKILLAKTLGELVQAIEEGIKRQESILVEEFIPGKIASVHSVPKFRGQGIYIFPLGNTFGNFSSTEKEKLTNLVKDLHKHINAKHYLKSNFVLTPRGKVYLLEIESTPDLKPNSHFSQVCESVGAKTHHVIEHMLENAI